MIVSKLGSAHETAAFPSAPRGSLKQQNKKACPAHAGAAEEKSPTAGIAWNGAGYR